MGEHVIHVVAEEKDKREKRIDLWLSVRWLLPSWP
jgi:hypothetical protein